MHPEDGGLLFRRIAMVLLARVPADIVHDTDQTHKVGLIRQDSAVPVLFLGLHYSPLSLTLPINSRTLDQKSPEGSRMRFIAKLAAVVIVGLLSTVTRADVLGSNPYTQLPTLDTCSGCIFVYIQFGSANAGEHVQSYQFYNGAGAGTTNVLTPILFENTGGQNFSIIGIGASSTGFAAGYNSVPFVLSQGVDTVLDSNTYFGYVDGDALGNTNTGTITSNYPDGPGAPGYFHSPAGPLSTSFSGAFTSWADVGQKNRTYSLQVTAPEPGFYAAFLLAAVFVGFTLRSRWARRS
jgi:hypothetical protein